MVSGRMMVGFGFILEEYAYFVIYLFIRTIVVDCKPLPVIDRFRFQRKTL